MDGTMKFSLIYLILVGLHPLQADLAIKEFEAYTNLVHNEETYIDPYPEQCKHILHVFANASADFTRCSIKFARPIRLCELCVKDYLKFDSAYQALLNTSVNGTSCKSLFFSHDRLEVVLEYHENVLDIWQKGHCDSCYNWSDKVPVLSNSTELFNDMFKVTSDCIVNNYYPNASNPDAVCVACMQSYLQLDEFYKTLSYDAIGVDSICVDIVDKMNATRYVWSKTLNCCKLRKSPEIIFLGCTGIISILPILFYLAVRYCGPIRDLPNVLRQTRFKQTLLTSVEGNIN